MPSPPLISAVIPVHNEEGFIEEALPHVIAAMESVERPYEIIIAENGSSDATASIARDFSESDPRIKVLSLTEPDYGAAMRLGFAAALGEWVVNFDIDYFSGDFLVAALERSSDSDLVLASKRAVGAQDRRSLLRRIGTWGFNVVLRVLFRSKVTDTHGMKMVRRTVVDRLLPEIRSTQDLFDTELVIRAERAGYRIVEVPAVVEEMREARSSFIGRVPRTLRGLWRIRRNLRSEAKT